MRTITEIVGTVASGTALNIFAPCRVIPWRATPFPVQDPGPAGAVVSRRPSPVHYSSGCDPMDVLPVDAIVVPTQFKTGSLLRGIRDWSQVFAKFALGAAAVISSLWK